MILILTEKPSVAQEFATFLNCDKKDGYHINNNSNNYLNDQVIVTYAIGHLLKIGNETPSPWTNEMLPIFPNFTYKSNPHTASQLKTITSLLPQADKLIIATDPGREGELIARLILNHAKFPMTKALRFWTSEALQPSVFEKYLNQLKPASSYDGLYQSAIARQHSDWIVGINLTIKCSLEANQTYSIGRVQTPTLALIVQRNSEINSFVKSYYYKIIGEFDKNGNKYTGELIYEKDYEPTKEEAAALQVEVLNEKAFIATKTIKQETKNPPSLHSLTTLQQEANKTFGLSAADTLALAQELYEKDRAISYPRSDSNHMAESSLSLVNEILENLNISIDVTPEEVGKRVFDDSKLTDHHALVPLKNLKKDDSPKSNVYQLILRRFEGAFKYPAVDESTLVETKAGKYHFKSESKKIIRDGWRELYPQKKQTKNLNFDFLNETNQVHLEGVKTTEHERTPPKQHDEASLLKVMSKMNLGTPATRADVIEKLLKIAYIERKAKNIVPLEKGVQLIEQTVERDFTNPEMTSKWEESFSLIEKGQKKYEEFIDEIKEWTTKEIELIQDIKFIQHARPLPPKMVAFAQSLAKQNGIVFKKNDFKNFDDLSKFIEDQKLKSQNLGVCKCGGSIVSFSKGWKCDKTDCNRVAWAESFGYKFKTEEAIKLIAGEIVSFSKLKKKSGETFSAKLQIDNLGKLSIV